MDSIKTWTGLLVEESVRMTEDRDKWRKYVHGVARPTLGLRTAKEQNRTWMKLCTVARSDGCSGVAGGSNVKKGSPYSITERRVPELIPVLGSQPAGDVSHKPGGRSPLLSARPAVTLATLKRAATNFAAR